MRSVNRRDFMTAAAAGVVGNSLLDAQASLGEQDSPGYIDAHSHIWTRDTRNYPLADGKTTADLDPRSFTTEELLKTARPNGVNRVVLIQHHIYHGWDNSYLVDAAQSQPDVFRVVGMVNDTEPNPNRVMQQLLRKYVTSFRITSLIRGKNDWLTGPGMAAMWKCAVDTRQSMGCLINPEDLPTVDRMCERFPETPVVIDHFARVGVDGMMRETDITQLCRLARHKHTYVKVSAFYALGKKMPPYDDLIPMIRRVCDAFGPQRLMWASDCPYQLGGDNSYEASLGLIRDRLDFLSHEDRNWILRGTANRVYFECNG